MGWCFWFLRSTEGFESSPPAYARGGGAVGGAPPGPPQTKQHNLPSTQKREAFLSSSLSAVLLLVSDYVRGGYTNRTIPIYQSTAQPLKCVARSRRLRTCTVLSNSAWTVCSCPTVPPREAVVRSRACCSRTLSPSAARRSASACLRSSKACTCIASSFRSARLSFDCSAAVSLFSPLSSASASGQTTGQNHAGWAKHSSQQHT